MTLDTAASHPKTSAADCCPLPYTSPTHLQAVAYLHGIVAADPDKARVLELGCLSGANLLPFATAYPQAQAIGIDLDEEKIAQGQIWAQQYGLTNLQLQAMDLASLLDSNLGKFDYILVHGVFGLISGEARSALLAYCYRHLSAKGVVCFSYSTYPGGKTEEILQDALNLHASLAETPEQQQASARAMLSYLALGMSAGNPQRAAIATLVEEAEQLGDVSLALNYLQGLNQPCYLLDFNAQITQEGLAYVGEIEPHTEIASHYGEQVDNLLRTICPTGNKILKQQYLDFNVGRKRRFSLLVAAERAEKLESEIDVSRLDKLSWAGSFRRVMLNKGLASNSYVTNTGIQISTDHELTQQILDILGNAWPASVSFKELIFNTHFPEKENDEQEHENNVRESLYTLLKQGMSSVHFCVGECAYRKSEFSALRVLPNCGDTYPAFNYWYESFALPSEALGLKTPMNLLDEEEEGSLALLDELHHKGLMIGSALAWQRYLQKRLELAKDVNEVIHNISPLIMYSSNASGGGLFKASDVIKVEKSRKEFINDPIDVKVKRQLYDLLQKQKYGEARTLAEELTVKQPNNLQNWITLERINFVTGDKDAAIFSLAKVISMHSNAWLVYSELASLLHNTYHYWEAINLAYRVIRCDESIAVAWNVVALVYLKFENMSSAEVCIEKAIKLLPNDAAILNAMAMVLDKKSDVESAIEYYRRAVSNAPDDLSLYSNLLFALLHNTNVTAAELFVEHRHYGELVESRINTDVSMNMFHQQDKDPDRVLRIGFVSGDLWAHPVSSFLAPVWDSVNREQFSLYVYSTSNHYDDTSRMFEKGASAWRNVAAKSDIELFEVIQRDKIDILFDLSGHTAYNRLSVFAMKPAPIQISWLGYPGTTGLKAMDYYLVMNHAPLPEVLDCQFTEKLLYVPFSRQFNPVAGSPMVNDLPALKNDYFTFASFNRPTKINNDVLSVWSKILSALPASKMIIGALPSHQTRDKIREKLESQGVQPEQLIFRERTNIINYLAMHQEIDLLLDTFPYTGGTTTNHALWMGVPTLTLAGDKLATLQGAANLSQVGLNEFIASSQTDYISKAISWSNNLDELNQIRHGLRNKIGRDIDAEGVTPATYFEQTLRAVWKAWCAGEQTKSYSIGY
ncbi:O-linked N-acetylglucosamine transferase family protein [Pectobacterium aroidearum]|uniref:O-linked N-acetylglucosamine transferase family protein n=1 Tax=Pectobacterium aroidearum TaxID=1201031 RepID=UPI00211400D5|nr:methyltransferase regulatory domain-containing protein [Pectobacterium aroidearum]UUE56204.1 methyltransferase regulatory domain-containing protein [Pectobacterium aroidearum]UUE68864.1 methyltransferase regulatory domain-containing protein [Pectobacterium aroidearum]UUE73234.1 methyltransferase regulatory domain-containing protein [Pectobacterium aroidearum]UUE77574.1 methyltransferase regulatory domain-containing protein [Pectobacterium aroidearum]WKA60993.1 methyltransferase regulatory d